MTLHPMTPPAVDRSQAELIGIAIDTDTGVAFVRAGSPPRLFGVGEGIAEVATLERTAHPRWVWWSIDTARALVAAGIRPARCWDLGAVHRLLIGGWRADPARVWAGAHGLDPAAVPEMQPIDLFTAGGDSDPEVPVRPDGYLRPDWVADGWATSYERMGKWADLALAVQARQADALAALTDHPAASATARSESVAELLCAELEHDGLPIDIVEAERIIGTFIGPRPTDAADEAHRATERDRAVLRHLPAGQEVDLRNPANVKSLLRRVGIEVADTRAWRLEQLRGTHPIVDDLLVWRKAERIATTFGYRWLDEHVAADRRLRGAWSGSDGAAGRMTATAGLHNMPAELRPAIVAEPGHTFVRADLGQIEPRVLAVVSGDDALATATHDDDMYSPVAARLGVERSVAKVAVLGAMYGQTTGHGAVALRGLESAYPVAMDYLRAADVAAQGGHDLRTHGGRRVAMGAGSDTQLSDRDARSRAAARGRYGRNAMVQGAAAELFKTWAVLVRARGAAIGGRLVLCLHDELLVECPRERSDEMIAVVDDCLQEAARRWAPSAAGAGGHRGRRAVRFVADTSCIDRWSDAK